MEFSFRGTDKTLYFLMFFGKTPLCPFFGKLSLFLTGHPLIVIGQFD
jgi:hypothetical protein